MNILVKKIFVTVIFFSSQYMVAAFSKDSENLALRVAVIGKNFEQVAKCLKKGADRDSTNSYGFTPLLIAARDNNWSIAELLIAEKATIDFQGYNKNTALHMAARYNSLDVVALLLRAKADTSLKDSDGKKAVDYAQEEKIRLLFS
jgi:ankyrin repeat protein